MKKKVLKKQTVKAAAKKAKKVVPQRRSKPTAPQLVPLAPQEEAAEKKLTKKELRAKNEALADKIAAAPDAPHIECRLVVGELSVPVDAADLCHTLGAGMWGHGEGLVDAYPDTVWAGLLAHLGLPAFPLDRAVAENPVKRLIQRLWYEAIQGHVPEERATVFTERDTAGQEKYKKDFPNVAVEAQAKSERAKTSFGRKPGTETRYTPTEALKDKKLVLGGQQVPLLAFFKASKFAPATTAEATTGMLEHGLVTSTKPERISAFYLCAWVKRGLLTR
jgi:hypothetical protein